jgi:hypothetical protein
VDSKSEVENPLFIFTPELSLDDRIQMVVPSFTALLSNTSRQLSGDCRPVFWFFLGDELQHERVFFLGPRPLDELRIEDLLPPMKTLHVGATWEGLGHFLPILAVANGDCLCEDDIFLLGPVALRASILVLSGSNFVSFIHSPSLFNFLLEKLHAVE